MVENKGFGIEDVFGLWTALEILESVREHLIDSQNSLATLKKEV